MAEIPAVFENGNVQVKSAAARPQLMAGFGVVVFGFAAIGSSALGLLPVWQLPGEWIGVNLAQVMLVAFAGCALMASIYATLGAVTPQNASDYKTAGRVVGGPLSFIASWGMVLAAGLFLGWVVALIPQKILPAFFTTLSVVYHIDTFYDTAKTIIQPQNVALIGSSIILLGFLLNLLPQKLFRAILLAGLALGLAAWGLVLYQMSATDPNTFGTSFNSLMGTYSFYNQVSTAAEVGMVRQTNDVLAAGLTSGLWIFFGFFLSGSFAGEMRKPSRSLLAGMLVPLAVLAGLMAAAFLLAYRFITPTWLSSASYLFSQDPAGQSMPWLPFYAAVLTPAPLFLWIAVVSTVLAVVNMVQVFLYALGRTVLGWAQEGSMPAIVATVHDATGSPLVALLLVAVVAIVGLVDAAAGAFLHSQVNLALVAAVCMLVPSAAVLLLPWRKNLFKDAPACLDWKLGPLPVLSILAILALAFLLGVIVLIVASGHTGILSLIVSGGLIALGAAWFYGSKKLIQK